MPGQVARLGSPFYARGAAAVAPDLLGTILCHRRGGRVQRARVVETEAYVGAHDLACHAARGRTRRTNTMFGPPGRAYVYLIYGMHDMLNVVTGAEGDPQAVLVRAVEPVANVEGPTHGPGRLTRSLGITVAEHNAEDLIGGRLWFEEGRAPAAVVTTTRVGVDYAGEWAGRPLRFYEQGNPHVSVP